MRKWQTSIGLDPGLTVMTVITAKLLGVSINTWSSDFFWESVKVYMFLHFQFS